jgi:hypothetical protein
MISSDFVNEMSSRKRFRETMAYGTPDRIPYFEEGIRKEVIKVWCKQGLPGHADLSRLFPCDHRERMEVDLNPRPDLGRWPRTAAELDTFQRHLDHQDKERLPKQWSGLVRAWQNRNHVLMLYVHRGFFQTMGVRSWPRFLEVMYLVIDNPEVVRRMMAIQGHFSANLTERVLKEVSIDAAVFSDRYGVETIILQTYANARMLIPSFLRWGFNCLWACEVNIDTMDYRGIRREFGRDLRLIGGIDLDCLRNDKKAIRREIETKVPPLIEEGGYVPLADGRVREDVPFDNYVYYRKLLEKITSGGT